MGIYYEDLYPLIKPLHNVSPSDVRGSCRFLTCPPQHAHHQRNNNDASASNQPTANGRDPDPNISSPVCDFQPEAPPFALLSSSAPHVLSQKFAPEIHTRASASTSQTLTASSSSGKSTPAPTPALKPSQSDSDPVIPPINAYGTLPPPLHSARSTSSFASVTSDGWGMGERRPLLRPALPRGEVDARRGVLGSVAGDLIPFADVLRGVGRMVGVGMKWRAREGDADVERSGDADGEDERGGIDGEPSGGCFLAVCPIFGDGGLGLWACVCSLEVALGGVETLEGPHPRNTPRVRAVVRETTDRLGITHAKHRPRVAGGGENLPLEILRALSVWLSVLDERGVITGRYVLRSKKCHGKY